MKLWRIATDYIKIKIGLINFIINMNENERKILKFLILTKKIDENLKKLESI